MMCAAFDDGVIDRVREAASSASSVDEAVERIAGEMPQELAVSRVGVRIYDAEHEFVIVAGVWSKQPTQLRAGISYPMVSSLGESFSSIAKSRTCISNSS